MDDPDRPGASFLRADLDLANSFLDIADTTRQVNDETGTSRMPGKRTTQWYAWHRRLASRIRNL